MNPTTDSQALLTKTFLNFNFFFVFVFLFSPLSLVFAQQQLHTTFPYSLLLCPTNVQLPVNKASDCHYSLQSLLSLSIILFLLSIYNIMQGSHTVTDSQSQKPKTKKQTQTVQFSGLAATQAPNQFSNFSSSVKTQTRNTQTPQAQFL